MTDHITANPIMTNQEYAFVVHETTRLFPGWKNPDANDEEKPANDQTTSKKNYLFSTPCLSLTIKAATAVAFTTSVIADFLKDDHHLVYSVTSHCFGAGAYLSNTAHHTQRFDAIDDKLDLVIEEVRETAKEMVNISSDLEKVNKKADAITDKVAKTESATSGLKEDMSHLQLTVQLGFELSGLQSELMTLTMNQMSQVIGKVDLSPELKMQQEQEIQKTKQDIKIVQAKIANTQGN